MATALIEIIPIIFLDFVKVNLLGSVADAIQHLCIEFEVIPAGCCTGLMQPINMGFYKPFKSNMKKSIDWLMS